MVGRSVSRRRSRRPYLLLWRPNEKHNLRSYPLPLATTTTKLSRSLVVIVRELSASSSVSSFDHRIGQIIICIPRVSTDFHFPTPSPTTRSDRAKSLVRNGRFQIARSFLTIQSSSAHRHLLATMVCSASSHYYYHQG